MLRVRGNCPRLFISRSLLPHPHLNTSPTTSNSSFRDRLLTSFASSSTYLIVRTSLRSSGMSISLPDSLICTLRELHRPHPSTAATRLWQASTASHLLPGFLRVRGSSLSAASDQCSDLAVVYPHLFHFMVELRLRSTRFTTRVVPTFKSPPSLGAHH